MAASAELLRTSSAAQLLEERFSLLKERHQEDLHHAEARLRAALKELELVRQQAERGLEERVAVLQQEHAAAMAALERRFLTDAEALEARLKDSLHRERLRCQAGIDERVQKLLSCLEADFSGSSGSNVGSTANAAGPTSPSQRKSPAVSSPTGKAAAAAPPLPLGLTAASGALAALRAQLPPSPAKLRGSSPAQPVINVSAVSGSTAAVAGASQASGPAAKQPTRPSIRPGPPTACSPVNPAAVPRKPAANAGLQARQPQSLQAQPLYTGSQQPAQTDNGRLFRQPIQGQARSDSSKSKEGQGGGLCLAHSSSSEYEDDSYYDGEEDSEESGLDTSRAPAVKVVNPPPPPSSSHLAFGTPRASLVCTAHGDGPGSRKRVHLNFNGSGTAPPADSRTYSPCLCRGSHAAPPPAGLLRRAAGGSSWLRTSADFDSD